MAETSEVLAAASGRLGLRKDPGYGPGMRQVELSVSTRSSEIDDEGKQKKIGKTFPAYLPGDLNTAVEALGEKVVFRMLINALVVDLQATERQKLAPAATGEGRKKAKYLEELGL